MPADLPTSAVAGVSTRQSRSTPSSTPALAGAAAVALCVLALAAWVSPWLLSGALGAGVVGLLVHGRRIGNGMASSLDDITLRGWEAARRGELGSVLLPRLGRSLHELKDWVEERDLALRDAIQRERLNTLELEVQTLELNDAHDRLAEANAELEAFTYSASHDLAVPLRTIESFAELLRETAFDVLDDSAADFVNRIQATASRTRALIADLLVLSRMRDGGETVFVEIDLGEMVESIASELYEALPGKFVVEHGPLPKLVAPAERVRPILQNLIQNGLKYNVSDIPRVVVDGTSDGGIVFIDIVDNGIGIPEEDRDEVFGLFRRGQAAASWSGTGAGLAIARRAARSLNGELWLQGSSPEGSHFALALPSGTEPPEAADPARPWLSNYIERRDDEEPAPAAAG